MNIHKIKEIIGDSVDYNRHYKKIECDKVEFSLDGYLTSPEEVGILSFVTDAINEKLLRETPVDFDDTEEYYNPPIMPNEKPSER